MSNVIAAPLESQPWLRLWLPEDYWKANPGIDDDFLWDHTQLPGTEHLPDNSMPRPLQAFSGVPFLFLLGRPGSGKSWELAEARKQGWLGSHCHWIEGKEFGSDIAATLDRLVAGATGPARLCIDGLDEVLLEHPNFVPQLKRWLLGHLGPDGEPDFHLAITCRWADWPVDRVKDLASLWQADRSAYLMLCPLRRSDAVTTIQQQLKSDAETFWSQMHDHQLRPVACWPQGLLGLLEQFSKSEKKSICEGYSLAIADQISRHCRLTDSPDDSGRWAAALTLDENWCRRLAGRLAAAMIWSGRSRLNLSLPSASVEGLTASDFKDHTELWQGSLKPVLTRDLDDLVRKTRLFRKLSDDSAWVFASQVHQEFLAAEWLDAQKLDEPRLKQLFGREDDDRWRVQPALGAVAAWLAGRNKPFRQIVIKHDPLVLLRMDGARIAESERSEVVEALLDATEQIGVLDPAIRQAHLGSVAHSGLHAQLERWLRRSDVCEAAKELALEIAEKTRLESLAPVLWELCPEVTGRVKNEMAGALYHLAKSPEYDAKWQSVLRGDMPIDGYGTLLGAAIELQINSGKRPVADALEWLVPARHFDVYGLFDSVVRILPEKLTLDDLPAVFAKLAENPVLVRDTLETPNHLHKAAIKLAVSHFAKPEVARVLCKYWHRCLVDNVSPHHDLNSGWKAEELGIKNDDHRRSIIRALMLHPSFVIDTEMKWIRSNEYMIIDDDFDWGLAELFRAAPEDRWRWALMLRLPLWKADLQGERGSRLNEAWATMPEIHAILPKPEIGENLSHAIIRLSEESRLKKESEAAGWQSQREERDAKYKADLDRYTQKCKKLHEEGQMTWGGVVRALAARAHGAGPSMVTYEPISKIGSDDGWMIEAAIRYLLDKKHVEISDGIGGLLALAACLPRVFEDDVLRDAIGRNWLAPMLADFSMSSLGKVPEGISLELFAKWFPDKLPSALEAVIRRRYLNKGELGELHSFQSIWSEECGVRLAQILRDEPVQVEGFFNAMRMLAEKNESLAVFVVRFWLEKEKSNTLNHGQKAALIGAALLMFDGRCVKDAFDSDLLNCLEVVRDAIWRFVWMLDFHDWRIDFSNWSDVSIQLVAELCGRAYTRVGRRLSSGRSFGEVTGEDEAIDFRDRIIGEATQRGIYLDLPVTVDQDTPEEAVSRLHAVNWHRNEATKARLRASRDLLLPTSLFRLCSTPHARLARDADELMAAVVASVRRWEQSLRNGGWRHLWDLRPLRARGEEDIAKELRDWLHADLNIITEREVELRSERRTDVLVQTLTQWGQKLTVLIELKKVRKDKTNAKERRTAMQTQLRDTYLAQRLNEGWTHGLFIVAWTPEPGHKLDSNEAMQAEAEFLEKQAVDLSKPPFVLAGMVVDARTVKK